VPDTEILKAGRKRFSEVDLDVLQEGKRNDGAERLAKA
jgi:hypothetical protein